MSQPQSYKNHIRWYPPHHFVFYPLMLALMGSSVYCGYQDRENCTLWIFITIILAVITWLAFMLRQHYALTLQNRLVLMELRYRYLAVTGQRLELLEGRLSEGQLFALRFAPDDELPQLAQKAISENLKPGAIKRSIKNWYADDRRL